ncbi:MAG: phosphatase [Planctomycetaceae bacterium]|nr:phosphatase [Planctomycetaceae bacterium]
MLAVTNRYDVLEPKNLFLLILAQLMSRSDKRNGSLPLRTLLLLGPTLLGQYLSLVHYRRQCRPWDEAVPGVLMGRKLTRIESAPLLENGAPAVLDLTAEFTDTRRFASSLYLSLAILDLTAPTAEQLQAGVDFITENVAAGGIVLVHGKVGYSRTAAIVGGYLMASGHCENVDEATALMRSARPPIVIRPEARAAMERYSILAPALGEPKSRPSS